jgi:hypothetical protein
MTVRRMSPIYASDVRRLGGVVLVSPLRDPSGGEQTFSVSHISRGGDCEFKSRSLGDEDQANAAARVLAEFTGAVMRR